MASPLAHWTMRPPTCWSTPPRTWFTYLLEPIAVSQRPSKGIYEDGFAQKHLFGDDAAAPALFRAGSLFNSAPYPVFALHWHSFHLNEHRSPRFHSQGTAQT